MGPVARPGSPCEIMACGRRACLSLCVSASLGHLLTNGAVRKTGRQGQRQLHLGQLSHVPPPVWNVSFERGAQVPAPASGPLSGLPLPPASSPRRPPLFFSFPPDSPHFFLPFPPICLPFLGEPHRHHSRHCKCTPRCYLEPLRS